MGEKEKSALKYIRDLVYFTPARTHFISGLKSRVLKLIFFSLKMMVKSGLEFDLKLTEPRPSELLLSNAKKSAQ